MALNLFLVVCLARKLHCHRDLTIEMIIFVFKFLD